MDQLPLINWILVVDETLLDTEHVKIPPILPESLRECVYFPVTGLSNSLSVSSVTVVRSLYQVTVVAGPPVEIHLRVNSGVPAVSSDVSVKLISSVTATLPEREMDQSVEESGRGKITCKITH